MPNAWRTARVERPPSSQYCEEQRQPALRIERREIRHGAIAQRIRRLRRRRPAREALPRARRASASRAARARRSPPARPRAAIRARRSSRSPRRTSAAAGRRAARAARDARARGAAPRCGSPASEPAPRPCITMRRDSGKAIAAPHSGASGPTHCAESRARPARWRSARAAAGAAATGKLSFATARVEQRCARGGRRSGRRRR